MEKMNQFEIDKERVLKQWTPIIEKLDAHIKDPIESWITKYCEYQHNSIFDDKYLLGGGSII